MGTPLNTEIFLEMVSSKKQKVAERSATFAEYQWVVHTPGLN